MKKIIHEAKQVTLNKKERAALDFHIEMLFARAGIPMERRDPAKKRWISSPYYLEAQAWYHWFKKQSYAGAAVFGLVLFLSTGMAGAAAEDALPGDFLYSIKVHLNEGVQSLFKIPGESRAKFEALRATRRLEEAEALAKSGKLTDKALSTIAANFERHREKLSQELSALEKTESGKKAAEILRDFEAFLADHSDILSRFRQN